MNIPRAFLLAWFMGSSTSGLADSSLADSIYDFPGDDGPSDGPSTAQEEQQSGNSLIQHGGLPDPDEGGGDAGGLYEYRIGVLDLLEVEVFMVEGMNYVSRVNSKGYISLPLIGGLKVVGLTVEEAERLIEKKLGEDYLQEPHVTVFVKEYESQKITLEGWVKDPGVYPLKGRTTLLQAIALADGMTRLADPSEVIIFRRVSGGKSTGYRIDINKIRSGEIKDPLVLSNDIIVVPEHGSKSIIEAITRTLRGFIGFGTL